MKTTLAKLSICACGFPVLKVTIPMGTEYEIIPEKTTVMHWRCGGCGLWSNVDCVWSDGKIVPGMGGYLPKGIFEYYVMQEGKN